MISFLHDHRDHRDHHDHHNHDDDDHMVSEVGEAVGDVTAQEIVTFQPQFLPNALDQSSSS